MATNPNGNVKLIKLAISIASVAAIAGIAGRLAGEHTSAGSGQDPLASAVPAPEEGPGVDGVPATGQFRSLPYWRGERGAGRRHDRRGGWDDDWDDDWDDSWDDGWNDGEGSKDGARLWFGPRNSAADGAQAGVRPPRTRTRQS